MENYCLKKTVCVFYIRYVLVGASDARAWVCQYVSSTCCVWPQSRSETHCCAAAAAGPTLTAQHSSMVQRATGFESGKIDDLDSGHSGHQHPLLSRLGRQRQAVLWWKQQERREPLEQPQPLGQPQPPEQPQLLEQLQPWHTEHQ
jgi:hypothetical protein